MSARRTRSAARPETILPAAPAPQRPASSSAAFLAGRDAAVQVLRDLQAAGVAGCSIEAADRAGRPQTDVLLRAVLDAAQQPEKLLGLCAVLTDAVGLESSLSEGPSGYLAFSAADMLGGQRRARGGVR